VPIPEFVQRLRSRVGTDLLMLPAVTAVTFDDAGRLLLARRADTGRWALVGGIMEPGEEVAETLVREVLEETAVRVRPERLTGVYTHAGVVHGNGDQCCYVVTAFRCRHVDDESLDVGWFALDDLPSLQPWYREQLDDALRLEREAAFRSPPTLRTRRAGG
jgi:8-oxo-dGTP pyrophosphatase MutT (NUDIX family)